MTVHCKECGQPTKAIEESFGYAGTHCNGGRAGTHHTGVYVSECCAADLRDDETRICDVCDSECSDWAGIGEDLIQCRDCADKAEAQYLNHCRIAIMRAS